MMILLLLTFITKEVFNLIHGRRTMTRTFIRKVGGKIFANRVKRI